MAHNLLLLQEVNYRDQFSTTQQTQDTETGCACLEPGHTMMWLLGTSITLYYQEMNAAERPTLFRPKGAVTQGNLNQAQYYTELLNQIGQENR